MTNTPFKIEEQPNLKRFDNKKRTNALVENITKYTSDLTLTQGNYVSISQLFDLPNKELSPTENIYVSITELIELPNTKVAKQKEQANVLSHEDNVTPTQEDFIKEYLGLGGLNIVLKELDDAQYTINGRFGSIPALRSNIPLSNEVGQDIITAHTNKSISKGQAAALNVELTLYCNKKPCDTDTESYVSTYGNTNISRVFKEIDRRDAESNAKINELMGL